MATLNNPAAPPRFRDSNKGECRTGGWNKLAGNRLLNRKPCASEAERLFTNEDHR